MIILAIEVGASAVQAAVLDSETGKPIGPLGKIILQLDAPSPDAAEIPGQRLWQCVAAAARAAVRHADINGTPGRDVAAVGMSSAPAGLVLLDKADEPLTPIRMQSDTRSRPAARQVAAAVGDEFLQTCGNRPLPGRISAVCFRQMLVDKPYLIQKVRTYLHANGWLAFRMTGEKAFDAANASFTGLYGTVTDQNWSSRWCEFFEVDPAWLPGVVDGRTTVGTMRSEAAAELGVPAGIPVKIGGANQSNAALAAGMAPGDLLHEVGATQTLAVLTEQAAPSPQLLTHRLGFGNGFVRLAHNPIGGEAFEWIRRLCFREQSEGEFLDKTIPEAIKQSTRVSLDPPFLAGNCLEIDAQRASYRDLELTTDRLDLLAGLLQAMVRRHRQAVLALGLGDTFRRVFLTGGGADIVRRLLPEYHSAAIHSLDEGPLFGVAKLFDS